MTIALPLGLDSLTKYLAVFLLSLCFVEVVTFSDSGLSNVD